MKKPNKKKGTDKEMDKKSEMAMEMMKMDKKMAMAGKYGKAMKSGGKAKSKKK